MVRCLSVFLVLIPFLTHSIFFLFFLFLSVFSSFYPLPDSLYFFFLCTTSERLAGVLAYLEASETGPNANREGDAKTAYADQLRSWTL